MSRILGIILMIVGALGLVYGGFSYTQQEHSGVGSMDTSFFQKDSLRIPPMAGIVVMAGGTLLFASSFFGRKKKDDGLVSKEAVVHVDEVVHKEWKANS